MWNERVLIKWIVDGCGWIDSSQQLNRLLSGIVDFDG
jgi:hypothetical protein